MKLWSRRPCCAATRIMDRRTSQQRTMNEHDQPTPRTMKIIVFFPTPPPLPLLLLVSIVDLGYNADWICIASASRVKVYVDNSPGSKLCRWLRAGVTMTRDSVWTEFNTKRNGGTELNRCLNGRPRLCIASFMGQWKLYLHIPTHAEPLRPRVEEKFCGSAGGSETGRPRGNLKAPCTYIIRASKAILASE